MSENKQSSVVIVGDGKIVAKNQDTVAVGPDGVTIQVSGDVVPFPSGLGEPAQRERERFETAYEAFLGESLKIPLSILVWGPNPLSDSPVARKRIEIREALEDLGHNVMFFEGLPIQTGNVSEKSKEFAQARAAHMIIILIEDAPGALAEAHDFCNHPDIAPKAYVMIPKKYEEGYSARGAIRDLSDGYGGVYWYEDEDLRICNVRKQAVKRTEARRRILGVSYLSNR